MFWLLAHKFTYFSKISINSVKIKRKSKEFPRLRWKCVPESAKTGKGLDMRRKTKENSTYNLVPLLRNK